MNQFLKEFFEGDVDLHDAWQIELETAISHKGVKSTQSFSQEFYFFLPASLQINPETYSKELFYSNRTNFVRKKTPDFPLEILVGKDPGSTDGIRWAKLLEECKDQSEENKEQAKKSLLLVANIFRASLRKRIYECFSVYLHASRRDDLGQFENEKLSQSIKEIAELVNLFLQKWDQEITPERSHEHVSSPSALGMFDIARKYISISIDSYLSGFILQINTYSCALYLKEAIQSLEAVLRQEKEYREKEFHEVSSFHTLSEEEKEKILYERGVYEKLIRSALYLPLEKRSFSQRWNNIIASFAAGIAAFIYLFVLFWKSTFLVMNSMTFVVLSSMLYMLKDRIKEGLKNLFQRQAGRFFDDFRTDIFASQDERHVSFGSIHEYFMFLISKFLPKDIASIRKMAMGLNISLEDRQETILYYRKKIVLHSPEKKYFMHENESVTESNKGTLHTIFRLHFRTLLEKASNPYEEIATFDGNSRSPTRELLPKVYHVNLVIKTTRLAPTNSHKTNEEQVVYQKYRLFVDKSGIKRVVRLYEGSHYLS